MEIDNCVVCGKYLKDIGEQEQGMCNKCDNKTDAIAKELDKALIIDDVSNNEAVLQYQTCQRGKMIRCKCKSDQDCKEQSEVAYYCECDAPLVRTDVSGTEYCGICEWDIEQ